jgi:hypothetical protein
VAARISAPSDVHISHTACAEEPTQVYPAGDGCHAELLAGWWAQLVSLGLEALRRRAAEPVTGPVAEVVAVGEVSRA